MLRVRQHLEACRAGGEEAPVGFRVYDFREYDSGFCICRVASAHPHSVAMHVFASANDGKTHSIICNLSSYFISIAWKHVIRTCCQNSSVSTIYQNVCVSLCPTRAWPLHLQVIVLDDSSDEELRPAGLPRKRPATERAMQQHRGAAAAAQPRQQLLNLKLKHQPVSTPVHLPKP